MELLASAAAAVASCFKCDGPHRINQCKAKSRVHKKYCDDKYQCYKEARSKPAAPAALAAPEAPAVPEKKVKFAKAAHATKKRKPAVDIELASEEDVRVSNIKIAKSAHESKSYFRNM